jgi:protocatechuate 3,4-dioxygenase alpha subunit
MPQALGYLKETASQTAGPYVHIGLTPNFSGISGVYPDDLGTAMVNDKTRGERITIKCRVIDGTGTPLKDSLIEIWQADADGRYAHPADPRGSNSGFRGFGRFGTGTDPENRFAFHTVKPGSIDGVQAPHISIIVFMRGMLSHAYTRLYFSDEAAANAQDPVLLSVPQERRATLIAAREDTGAGPLYRFDIVIQGENETVFFDV